MTTTDTSLALVDKKLEEMGIPIRLRQVPYDDAQFIQRGMVALEAAHSYLVEAGTIFGVVFVHHPEPRDFAATLDLHGANPQWAISSIMTAREAGAISLNPGDAAKAEPRRLAKNASHIVGVSDQQIFNFIDTGDTDKLEQIDTIIRDNKRLRNENSRLKVDKEAALISARQSADHASKADQRIAEAFDADGNPVWIPANVDDRELLSRIRNARNRSSLSALAIKKLRCLGEVTPDVVALLVAELGAIQAENDAAIALVKASVGLVSQDEAHALLGEFDRIDRDEVGPAIEIVEGRARRKPAPETAELVETEPALVEPKPTPKSDRSKHPKLVDLESNY